MKYIITREILKAGVKISIYTFVCPHCGEMFPEDRRKEIKTITLKDSITCEAEQIDVCPACGILSERRLK